MSYTDIDIKKMSDIMNATWPTLATSELELTFEQPTYELFNMMFNGVKQKGGENIISYISMGDVGNAKMVASGWEPDTKSKKNLTHKITSEWVHATTNESFDMLSLAKNSGPERIYDEFQSKIENMIREFADLLQPTLLLSPTSANDSKNPIGFAGWFPLGTDGSTGDWNAYDGIYNDGSGTTFDLGGISCSSSSNEKWASYYHDHLGKLGDHLIDAINKATHKLGFRAPTHPRKVGENLQWKGFKFYTNLEVITNLENHQRLSDDKIGPVENWQGLPLYNGIPMMYVSELDTAKTNLYGTNPFFMINHNIVKLSVLRGFNFKMGEAMPDSDSHNIINKALDVGYNIHCTNRRNGGGLISEQ